MKRRVGCFSLLFISSLIVGTVIGIIFEVGRITATNGKTLPTNTPVPTTTPPSDKPTILFIGVNQLPPQTSYLESAWLASQEFHLDNGSTTINITLEPLYPVVQSMDPSPALSPYIKPHQPLTFNPNNLETLINLAPLRDANISLDQIIILDEFFMNSAILLSDPAHTTTTLEAPDTSLFVKPWNDPAGAYQQQYSILTNLCYHPNNYFHFQIANTLKALYQDHIRSQLTADELFSMWQINVNLGDIQIICDIQPAP